MKIISHDDFKIYVTNLSKEIDTYCQENNIKIDYVVPILRNGAVPAVYLANNLDIINFAPIQIKKVKQTNDEYDYMILLNSLKGLDKDKEYNLLVVESSYNSGKSVDIALDEIIKTLPKTKILFACVCVRDKNNLPRNVKKNFYGAEPSEKLIYPWENIN